MTAPSTETTEARIAAKRALREAIAAQQGDPSHGAVARAIAALATLNPTPAPAHHPCLEGHWRLISAPSFPDGELRADGRYMYTLGRLAFNMFPPQDLKVVINQVFQPVVPIPDTGQYTHDILVHFTTLGDDLPPLRGIVRNLGVCEPGRDSVLKVRFTGGALEPADDADRQQWRAIFEHPAASGELNLKAWFQRLLLQWMFGLVPPKGMDADSGRMEFAMKRSPTGSLEILYLDDELRITKGQKETVLICDRV